MENDGQNMLHRLLGMLQPRGNHLHKIICYLVAHLGILIQQSLEFLSVQRENFRLLQTSARRRKYVRFHQCRPAKTATAGQDVNCGPFGRATAYGKLRFQSHLARFESLNIVALRPFAKHHCPCFIELLLTERQQLIQLFVGQALEYFRGFQCFLD